MTGLSACAQQGEDITSPHKNKVSICGLSIRFNFHEDVLNYQGREYEDR